MAAEQAKDQAQKSKFRRLAMQKIRKKNRADKGPWLTRADTIHAKAVNMYKSVGFEVKMESLANIEMMLTNFNQIVLQNAVVNKYFVCFDLPVYQLAGGVKPLISHSLRNTRPQE